MNLTFKRGDFGNSKKGVEIEFSVLAIIGGEGNMRQSEENAPFCRLFYKIKKLVIFGYDQSSRFSIHNSDSLAKKIQLSSYMKTTQQSVILNLLGM